MQVVSALANAGVQRLKQTWTAIPKPAMTALDDLKTLCEQKKNFQNLRFAAEESIKMKKAFVPYFPLWLTDLMMLEETALMDGDSGEVSHVGLIRRTQIIDRFLACQKVAYVPDALHHHHLLDYVLKRSCVCMDDEALFQMSLVAEPREPK